MDDKNKKYLPILDTVSKVSILLESIKDSKYDYIEIVDPKTNKCIMKIKSNLTENQYVDFLDTFFDNGFIVRSISKNDFDTLQSGDVISFNL